MATTSKTRSNRRARVSPAPVEAPERRTEPIQFGTMTEHGYVPSSHVEIVRCPVYEPELTLYVYFNTSIAYGFINTGFEMEGNDEVEKACRRMAVLIADIQGWNFYDPFRKKSIPKPDPEDWTTYMPLCAASGLCTALGKWINGVGLLTALNQSMGNSTTA